MNTTASRQLLDQLLTHMHTMEAPNDASSLLGGYDACRSFSQRLFESGTLNRPAFRMLNEIWLCITRPLEKPCPAKNLQDRVFQ